MQRIKGRVLSTLRSHGRDVRVNDLGEFCHVFLFTQRSVYVSVCRHTYVCSYAHTYIYRSGLCSPGFSAVKPWIWASAPTPSPPFWQLWRFCCAVGSPFTWLLPLWVLTHTEELQKDRFPRWRSCLTSAGWALFSLDVLCCTKVLDSGGAGTCFVLFLLTESTELRPVIRLAKLVRNAKNNALGRERLTPEDWRMCYVS